MAERFANRKTPGRRIPDAAAAASGQPATCPPGPASGMAGKTAGANDHVAVMQGSAIILSNPARWAAGNC